MNKRQSGFTLVEIAIVLVIIGLLLGGVLKGQEMIANARYKNLQSEIESYKAAFYTFQDRFGALPGDFLTANAQARLNAASPGGNNNGIIGNNNNQACGGNATEACVVWQQLKYANLISGNPATQGNAGNPIHAYGAQVQGIFNGPNGNRAGVWIQLQNIPGDVGMRLDQDLDDAAGTTGTVFCLTGCTGATYPLGGGLVTVRVLI